MSDTKMRNARERFMVSNYLVNNASLIHAIPTNTERARHVAEALGIEITVSKLVTAAVAAGLTLERVPAAKAVPGAKLAQLHQAMFDRLGALEERFTTLDQRLGALGQRLAALATRL